MRSLRAVVASVVVIVSAVPVASANEPYEMPRVISWGRYDGGGLVFCTGEICSGALATLEQRHSRLTDHGTLVRDEVVDKDAFCAHMEKERPEGCDEDEPPSTPGLDPGWSPNGCGTGGLSNLLADSGQEVAMRNHYSGDFHAPFPGVSFKSSCDAHDMCWGVGASRSQCDSNFRSSMMSACGALVNSTSRTTCEAFASTYFAAVSITAIGDRNYAAARADRTCALWAHDKWVNGCDLE